MALPLTKKDYLPHNSKLFDQWYKNFIDTLALADTVADFANMGATFTAGAAAVTADYAIWHAIFNTWNTAATHTPSATDQKNKAQATSTSIIRPFAAEITAYIGSDVKSTPANLAEDRDLLKDLGLSIPYFMDANVQFSKRQNQFPTFTPIVNVKSAQRGKLYLKYEHVEVGAGGARVLRKSTRMPEGVMSVEVSITNGVNGVVANLTRSPQLVELVDFIGQPMTIVGRYVGRKGRKSDWGPSIVYTVPGGTTASL